MKQKEKKSTISWILEFAGIKKWFYIFSIYAAIVGVGFGILPYLVMTKIVFQLMNGTRDWSLYLKECELMAVLWCCRYLFHGISTTLSQ